MKIGIIGAGNVGTGLGRHLAAKGHDVVVSFARTPDKVQDAARTIGGGARPGSPEDAARHGARSSSLRRPGQSLCKQYGTLPPSLQARSFGTRQTP